MDIEGSGNRPHFGNYWLTFSPYVLPVNGKLHMTSLEMPTVSASTAAFPPRVKVLCVLFFFSGFPALIYQLTWQRSLFRIFGVNTESVTIVVTAFMLGLGLGSLAGGWITRY